MAFDRRARISHKVFTNVIPSSRREEPNRWTGHGTIIIFTIKFCDSFTVIGKELHDPAIVPENVYNMDETGVLLGVLNSLKVLVSKQDLRNCRGTGVLNHCHWNVPLRTGDPIQKPWLVVARAHFEPKCAPQLFKLQHYENHIIEKDADTKNNRLS
jgi:hypothetical protein